MLEGEQQIIARGKQFEPGSDSGIGVRKRLERLAVDYAAARARQVVLRLRKFVRARIDPGAGARRTTRCDKAAHRFRCSGPACANTSSCLSARSYSPAKHRSSKRNVRRRASVGLSRTSALKALSASVSRPARYSSCAFITHPDSNQTAIQREVLQPIRDGRDSNREVTVELKAPPRRACQPRRCLQILESTLRQRAYVCCAAANVVGRRTSQ